MSVEKKIELQTSLSKITRARRLRIKLGFDHARTFAEHIGVEEDRWGQIERSGQISRALLIILCGKIPGLSADWLLFGKIDGLSLKMAKILTED